MDAFVWVCVFCLLPARCFPPTPLLLLLLLLLVFHRCRYMRMYNIYMYYTRTTSFFLRFFLQPVFHGPIPPLLFSSLALLPFIVRERKVVKNHKNGIKRRSQKDSPPLPLSFLLLSFLVRDPLVKEEVEEEEEEDGWFMSLCSPNPLPLFNNNKKRCREVCVCVKERERQTPSI